jgi:hypothetical protein
MKMVGSLSIRFHAQVIWTSVYLSNCWDWKGKCWHGVNSLILPSGPRGAFLLRHLFDYVEQFVWLLVDSNLNHYWNAFRWALLEARSFSWALVLSVPNSIKDTADVLTRNVTMRAAFGPEGPHSVCQCVKTSNSGLVHVSIFPNLWACMDIHMLHQQGRSWHS